MAETTQRIAFPPSEDFMNAVCTGATVAITCQFCGRTHFASRDRSCFEDGELADLRAKAAAEPDRYREYAGFTTVEFGILNGKQVVWGCPCNSARAYEDFIWEHQDLILAYLKARTKTEADAAQARLKAVSEL